jgi:hypothetical protein
VWERCGAADNDFMDVERVGCLGLFCLGFWVFSKKKAAPTKQRPWLCVRLLPKLALSPHTRKSTSSKCFPSFSSSKPKRYSSLPILFHEFTGNCHQFRCRSSSSAPAPTGALLSFSVSSAGCHRNKSAPFHRPISPLAAGRSSRSLSLPAAAAQDPCRPLVPSS